MQNISSSPKTIAIYVEDKPNKYFNELFTTNIDSISHLLYENGIQLVYLPMVLQDRDYLEIVEYNRPFLHSAIEERTLKEIYSGLKNRLRNRFPGEGLIIKTFYDYRIYTGYQLNPEKDLQSQLSDLFSLVKKLEDKNRFNTPSFRIVEDRELEEIPYEQAPPADQNFSTEAY